MSKIQCYAFTKENIELIFTDRNYNKTYSKNYDKRYYEELIAKSLIIGLGIVLYANPVLAAGDPFSKVGTKFLGYARSLGYWSCLVMSIVSIVKAALEDNPMGAWKKVLGYLLAFASLYFLPQLFDSLKEI